MNQPLSHHLLTMAYQNAWANHRLAKAWSQLSPAELAAPRVSFFPSLRATLNHILTCDWFYVDALERELRGDDPHPDCYVFFNQDEPFTHAHDLKREQALVDRRLIAYCEQMRDADLGQDRDHRPGHAATRQPLAPAVPSVRAPDPSSRAGSRHAQRHLGQTAATGRVFLCRRVRLEG